MKPNIKLTSADGLHWVFACASCKMVVPAEGYRCSCQPYPCGVCGETIGARSYCRHCAEARQQEAERKRFAAAKKIPAAEYSSWVYCAQNDEWWESVDEAVEDLKDRGRDVPEYFWGSTERRLHLDASDIVSSALENGEACEDAEADNIDGLQKALDAWCATQSLVWYLQDYKTAVVL